MKEEIIGFLINSVIYTDIDAVNVVKITKHYDQVITKNMAKFMSAMDLGHQWDKLASAPILFVVENEQIRMPTLKENNYKYYVWDKNNTVPQERFEHLE